MDMKKVEPEELVEGNIYLRKSSFGGTIFIFRDRFYRNMYEEKVLYTNEHHLMHRHSCHIKLAFKDYGILFELEENEIPIVILEEIE
jgi:hypothetical protein